MFFLEIVVITLGIRGKHRKNTIFFGSLWLVLGVKLMEINSNQQQLSSGYLANHQHYQLKNSIFANVGIDIKP